MSRAVTQKDIANWITANFSVPSTRIWFDEGLPGTLKIIIDHISREEQIKIHNLLSPMIPMGISLDIHRGKGIRLDIHRGKPPIPKKDQTINIRRPPIWDVGD